MVDESQRPGRVQQAMAAASALLIVWFSLPEQERRWMVLRTVGFAHRYAARLARAEGFAGMGDELKGRDPSPRYGGAVLAARVRDGLAEMLLKMRI